MTEFKPDTSLINKDLADRSHHGTSFDPEIRARQEIEGFAYDIQSVYEEVSKYARSEAQKEYVNGQMPLFQSRYAGLYNDLLAAKGRCFSVMITGGSGFDNSRHEKANRSEDNKYESMKEFKERVTSAIIRELKKMVVDEAGGEIPVLEAKLKSAQENHIKMVESNKIIHKKGVTKDDQIKSIIEVTGFSENEALKLLTTGGFHGWNLQNSNANIHAMQRHLEELRSKEARPSSELTFTGGHIIDNAEADRVQIIYDAKPSQDVITKLKSEGWHWSPSVPCWQRKRTPAALLSAKRITDTVVK